MEHFFGEFNRSGYSIYQKDAPQLDAIYQAGNCKYDSSQCLPIGSSGSLDIATIEEFCNSTGKALADERSGVWDGAGQIDDYKYNDYDAEAWKLIRKYETGIEREK
jgi:hypothetical protein